MREKVLCIACMMTLLAATCGHAQTPARPTSRALTQAVAQSTPQTTEDELHAVSQRAGVIFAGQVVAVRRHDGTNGATGIVEIDFAV